MPRRHVIWLLAVLGLSVFGWVVAQGGLAAPRGPLQFIKGLPGSYQDYDNLSLFIDVMQYVEQSYVHELSPEDRRKFIERAIQGALNGLDEHSAFFNYRDYRQFKKSNEGAFGGIGVTMNVNRETKRLTVISPMVGTPAYKAGIKPGDEIEKIDGVSAVGLSSDDAVEKITGKPGTTVTLTIRHRGSPRTIDMTLTRQIIELEGVMGDARDSEQQWDFLIDKTQKIGYIRLVQFNSKCVSELKAALAKLEAAGVRGLVLDLRNNPGGQLEAATEICDLFLTEGKIVSVEGRTRASQVYEAHQEGTMLLPPSTHPMVVLVNENSASASEIVASALQDHRRATIIGERTFGKGSVQNLVPMEGGKSAMKITTAKYIRPSGKNIHRFPDSTEESDWGVRPDIELKLSQQEEIDYFLARRDRDVVRGVLSPAEQADQVASQLSPLASAWLLGQPLASLAALPDTAFAARATPPVARAFSDRVLERALEFLRSKLKAEGARAG